MGVPQNSILDPLLFAICINDLLLGACSNANFFANDASIFSVLYDTQKSANDMTKVLQTISNKWGNQWKISFNPTHKVVFSMGTTKINTPPLLFNLKHLSILLDTRLTFDDRIRSNKKH